MAKYQTNQKATASSGIEQEESLLLETASKEASFTSTVLELEKELKQVCVTINALNLNVFLLKCAHFNCFINLH